MINTIILGHALNILPQLPAESVNCVVTSPPYWGLRDYGIEPVIWDEDGEFYSESLKRYIPKNCKHEWGESKSVGDIRFRPGHNSLVGNNKNPAIYPIKHRPNETNPGKEGWYKDKGGLSSNPKQSNFCIKCGAWRGSLGLEPTFELYIKHLCDIFDEVKRVLRKDGTCFINIGDSYGGSGNASGHREDTRNLGYKTLEMGATRGNQKTTRQYAKSLLDIPYRFSIEMINRGWIKRNTIIWWKPNCMPASADDRFTVDFEYLFFFVKNNKTLFWTNEKTLECVDKNSLGIKGIEGKDWEWRKCPTCQGKGEIIGNALKDRNSPINIGIGVIDENTKVFRVCPRCKGSGKVRYSFWTGHDYWFEQQFEKYAPDTLPRMDRGVNFNKWTLGADGQTPHNLSQPRLNKKRGYKTKQPDKGTQYPQYHGKDINYGKQGRNKRCVWKIPTKSFKEAHFATFPETLIEPIIKAGCPEFVCKKCGKARIKILESTEEYKEYLGKGNLEEHHAGQETKTKFKVKANAEYKFRGYSDCGCSAGWESGINLDPFMGTGTTALVALKQRKRFIGIEIKQEYIDMSYKRISKVQQKIF